MNTCKAIFYNVVVSLLAFYLFGCDETESITGGEVIKEFKLFDTLGNEKYVFKSGEDFEMRLTIFNYSGRDLTYVNVGDPDVIFTIMQADTVVATSVDGLVFVQPITNLTLLKEATLINNWIAPNSIGRNPKISLSPGQYSAKVRHGDFFSDYWLEETSPLEFTIIK